MYAAIIDGLYVGNESFAWWTVFFGLASSAPKYFQSMCDAAFRTDTFDCNTVVVIVSAGINAILLLP